jgi:glutamate racemase
MIGIIDSGIGGRGIAAELKKLLPDVPIEYLGDRANFPYGSKPKQELNRILEHNIRMLLDKGAQLIVLACNSGSVTSLAYLRSIFSVPIVGVVPAIKPAAEHTKTKKIAIFATPITSTSAVYEDLIRQFCTGIEVFRIPFPNLATLIEYDRIAEAEQDIANIWQQYKDCGIDEVVLGCTHYTLIRDNIQRIVGQGVEVIDSNLAVAKQAKRVYEKLKT